ncbi:MAG: hypothetical protein WAU82_16530 [Candidatus Binatus sp.]|uniref:hypothetical protein n=1 Tax=Candidatus Binatus sp. TaxID=2811406 RepID=UPI003BAF2A6B
MSIKSGQSVRRLLTAILVIELAGLCLLKWPLLYNFDRFAFWDWGAYLVAHYLIQQGKLPVTDFGWQYGLLPLFLQELWFHLSAASPAFFLILSFPCALVSTLAIGGFANFESKIPGHALVFASLPFIVGFGDLPHYLEATLLSVALLLHAQGKREGSLAFATAACFTKPSMAYWYGLLLLIFLVVDLKRQGKLYFPSLVSALAPAAFTGLALAVLLVIRFGWIPLISSLLPLTASRNYQVLHFGWPELAQFLYLPSARLGYYIGTPVTFWLCATFYLTASVVAVCWRFLRNRAPIPGNFEIVLTCALMHLGYVVFFYGSATSWANYAYFLVLGVAATDAWSRASAKFVSGLCILAAIGNYAIFGSSIGAWKTMERSPVTASLYAPPAESAEWSYIASMVSNKKPLLLTWSGGADVLFPWLSKPLGPPFIDAGDETDIQHEVQQLRSAKTIVVPDLPGMGSPLTNWPRSDFKTALDDTRLVFKGNYFNVYERR